jgi:N-acetylneuraminic acid mutarotase
MKKQNNPSIKAHLLRVAFYLLLLSAGTLLAFFRPEAPANVSHRTLTFEERIAYQRAIEEVYWRHRIWPKERPDPKPPLDAVMSQAQLEQKVKDYLRKSQLVTDQRGSPITAEQLQAEMEGMAQHTKQPEVLHELFEALGSDPFVIAECVARPVLAQRLVTELNNEHRVELTTIAWLKRPLRSLVARAKTQSLVTMAALNANYTLPAISSPSAGCIDDTWTSTSITNAPDGRTLPTAVWTGSEMIVWGGTTDRNDGLDTGGRYNPSIDSWAPTSITNAPTARFVHTAVWTGSEMIVWGGYNNGSRLNTGGRYDPSTDTWTATTTANAPDGRYSHTAVWTGSEMVVWGGSGATHLNTGGRYNPTTDTWIATSTTSAPIGRELHTAVWTGKEMIVWGGVNNITNLNTGGRYIANTDSWTATSTTNAPTARYDHTAVWTGGKMIVWGGFNGGSLNTGGQYDPGTDSWTATSTSGAAAARYAHTAVWTGSEMIVWGGENPNVLNIGGRYDPGTDSWTATSTSGAPAARYWHTAVWTGSEMIVWGGGDNTDFFNTGGRYCAAAPSPTPTPTPTSTPTATPTATATATPMGCSVTSPACGSIVGYAPTEFTVNLSDPADPATVQASDFTVNGTPANSFSLSNGNTTISFFFFPSPALQGGNVMHIPAGAFNCGNGPVLEFNCGFRYFPSRPRPTPAPRP